jgi:hypothetical protein
MASNNNKHDKYETNYTPTSLCADRCTSVHHNPAYHVDCLRVTQEENTAAVACVEYNNTLENTVVITHNCSFCFT